MNALGETQTSETKRYDPDMEAQKQILGSFLRTVQRYGGKWKQIASGVCDPREAGKVSYSLEVLFFTGVLLFVFQLGSRRQINYRLRGNGAARAKYRALFGVEEIPHGDTLNYTYRRLQVDQVQEMVCRLMDHLMAQAEVRQWRLFGVYFLIAIDGTGVLTYRERHCAYCLTRKLTNGATCYYHPVLEAKLVTANGYAFSMMTEFIENRDPNATKQDCELKAFYRLAERLKQRFPQADFCLLMDGLFAGGPTLEVCESKHWKYMIVLTDDDLSSVNQEFEALLVLPPHNQHEIEVAKGVRQSYRWMNGIDYVDSTQKGHALNVLECVEWGGAGQTTKFKWLTNFTLLSHNSPTIANQAGRLRWKIENEGFNLQKTGGFALEHPFSHDETAHKIFYLLLQIALIFFQLMAKSQEFRSAFPKGVGSLKNMAYRLLEAWRNLRLEEPAFLELLALPLNTS